VDTGELSESGINVSGVYILEVNDGQKTVAKKFKKINSNIIESLTSL
jgi:nucleoside-triphosphatase THEP1